MRVPAKTLLLLGVLVACLALGIAQTGQPAHTWNAKWITSPDLPGKAPAVVHFRRVFDLPAVPSHFIVHVSADNSFLLHVNQQRVGNGPSKGDLAHWRYETYDLTPFLHTGSNVIAATVWNFAEHAAAAQISDRLGFLLQAGEGADTKVGTDENWEVETEHGIAAIPTPFNVLPNSYYAAEPREGMDASKFDWAWDAPEKGPGSHWTKASPVGDATLRGGELVLNNWQLVADPLPPMERKLLPFGKIVRSGGVAHADQFPGAPLTILPNTRSSILIDNGELTTAYPELTIGGGRGASIRITYAEALKDAKGEKGKRNEIEGKEISGIYDEFLLAGAEQETFSPLIWRTWRYLQIDVTTRDQPLEIKQFRCWFTAFPFEERAKFSSDDPELSILWSIGWRTARLDAHDTYMDTPYWEQLQYIGDTRIQALISYSVAGDDRLARQAIAAFDNSRIPDGITLSRYPTGLFQAIPTFSLMWVGMLRDFALYHDDAAFVREHLPGTRAVLDWFLLHQKANGLLDKLPWWSFIDWTDGFPFGVPPQTAMGDSAPITLQFVQALRDAAQLEAVYGEPSRAELYKKAAAHASQAVRSLCWDDRAGLIADTPERQHFSQQANILAVWLDVIPREQQKQVLVKTLSVSDATFKTDTPPPPMSKASYYFRFYLARALDHVGLADRYLELLQPWRGMIALGLTTWAEVPEPSRSDSHAWSAHPNYDLLTLVAGIRPSGFGFNNVTIEPHLGPLKRVSAVFPHRQGEIRATYTADGQAVKAHIELPSALSGKLVWQGRDYPLHEGAQEIDLHQ